MYCRYLIVGGARAVCPARRSCLRMTPHSSDRDCGGGDNNLSLIARPSARARPNALSPHDECIYDPQFALREREREREGGSVGVNAW